MKKAIIITGYTLAYLASPILLSLVIGGVLHLIGVLQLMDLWLVSLVFLVLGMIVGNFWLGFLIDHYEKRYKHL